MRAKPVGDTTFKVHLDGFNQLPLLTGQTDKGARDDFYYLNDDGALVAMRWGNWKAAFCEQRTGGGFAVWRDPFTCLRVPMIFNLRMEPDERADLYSNQYDDWQFKNGYMIAEALMRAGNFLQTFAEYPPNQVQAGFTIDQIQAEVEEAIRAKVAQRK